MWHRIDCIVILLLVLGRVTFSMESVRVAADNKGFILIPSGKPFHPWGHNYASNDGLEDPAKLPLDQIDRDLLAMKGMHANVIRIHLQFAKFMDGPEKPNAKSLERLTQVLALAEKRGIYVDVTGLACYQKAARAAWYDALADKDRWVVQARFWEAIARTCADSPAVFCYDLVNEPIVFGTRKEGWYTGNFGGYDFLQRLSLDQADRRRNDVAAEWTHTLVAAIHKHDPSHLITIGMLPAWGIAPQAVAKDLDFIAVHIYPTTGKVDDAIANLKQFDVAKPIVIEETFPLSCGVEDERAFLLKSRGIASGWIGHYGESESELRVLNANGKLTPGQSLALSWYELFRKLGPEMLGENW